MTEDRIKKIEAEIEQLKEYFERMIDSHKTVVELLKFHQKQLEILRFGSELNRDNIN